MLKQIIKKLICNHERMVFVGADGEGENTRLIHRCPFCGHIVVESVKVKTK